MKCSIEGCERKRVGRGWCKLHWQRWSRHGDPNAAEPMPGISGWAGDDTTYTAVHHRLRNRRGPASAYTCPCGAQARDWAFDEPSGFSTDLSRYTAMCRSCHLILDRGVA